MALGTLSADDMVGQDDLKLAVISFDGDDAYPTGGSAAFQTAVRALLDRLAHEATDVIEFFIGGLHAFVHRFVAHRLEANRRVTREANHVERRLQSLDGVEILPVRRPVPWQTVHDRIGCDVFNGLH